MAKEHSDKKQDEDFDVPWAANLAHKPDPNRVTSLQMPPLGHFEPRSAGENLPADPATAHPARQRTTGLARQHDPQAIPAEPSYYDVPILKEPVWSREIPIYFYLGGLAAGSYIVGRVAERSGGEEFRGAAKWGAYLSLAALIPCPPLLIADLGDRKRFHHMLRVWKPTSPMNLGTWAITAFGGVVTYEALRQFLIARDEGQHRPPGIVRRWVENPLIRMAHHAAGMPLALLVASYTGVLLSCTSNPLWCRSAWLSPMFAASAISTGAEAVGLALDATTNEDPEDEDADAAQRVLKKIDTLAHAAEGAAMTGYMRQTGEKAQTLRSGKMKKFHEVAAVTIIAAEVIKLLPLPPRARKPARMFAAALGLVGGLAMRWAITQGGKEAAANPHTSRLVSRPRT